MQLQPQTEHGTFTDPRDGREYKTVKIGNLVWMAENLNYENRDNKYGESRWYSSDPANGEEYGRLYDSDAATSAAPPGWHLPTDMDWDTLFAELSFEQLANVFKPTAGGFDEKKNGYGKNLGIYGYWWSATKHWLEGLCYNSYVSYNPKDIFWRMVMNDEESNFKLFSIRCVKDVN